MATMMSSPSSDQLVAPAPGTVPGPVASPALAGPILSARQFDVVRQLMYRVAGINLSAGKEGLVRSRLAPRLRELGLSDFDAYLDHIDRDVSGVEFRQFVDVLTTNKTSFFREPEHFDLLQREILPALAARDTPARVWSAGCSSGEEPYTIAIVAREILGPGADHVRILATDLSTRILRRAREAVYRDQDLADVPPGLARRHFARAPERPGAQRVVDATRALVRFARLNLIDDWPMHGPFDVIFCRNVMIYFDRPTQQRLVERYSQMLAPGGWLYVGHSESLTALDHELHYVQPAVYRKPA
jgi:chemotaxis protein methyltransferase CheR